LNRYAGNIGVQFEAPNYTVARHIMTVLQSAVEMAAGEDQITVSTIITVQSVPTHKEQ
jgi:hypothetical protein